MPSLLTQSSTHLNHQTTNHPERKQGTMDEIFKNEQGHVLRQGSNLFVEVVERHDRMNNPVYREPTPDEERALLRAALLDVDNRRRTAEYDAMGVK